MPQSDLCLSRSIKFNCSTLKEIPALTEATVLSAATSYTCRQAVWKKPGIFPPPKIQKTRCGTSPRTILLPRVTPTVLYNLLQNIQLEGTCLGEVRLAGCSGACPGSIAVCLVSAAVPRRPITPLAAAAAQRDAPSWLLLRNRGSCPADGNSPAQGAQHRTSHPQEFRLPCFADLKKGLPTTLLAQSMSSQG